MKSSTQYSRWLVLSLDLAISVAASLFSVLFVRLIKNEMLGFQSLALEWILYAFGCSVVSFLLFGTHKIIIKHSTFRSLAKVISAAVFKELLLFCFVAAGVLPFKSPLFGMALLMFDFLLTSLMLAVARIFIIVIADSSRKMSDTEVGRIGVMMYGTSDESVSFVTGLENSPFYNVVGFITRNAQRDGMTIRDKKAYYISDEQDLERLKVGQGLESVLFVAGDEVNAKPFIEMCIAHHVNVLVSPRISKLSEDTEEDGPVAGGKVEMSEVGFIADGMSWFGRQVKRGGDAFISAILIVVFSPLMLICWLALKLTDKGPAIYRQERIGRFGKPFYILKFRSMRLDAEAAGPQLMQGEKDPRLTKVGGFLRAHHLDELPQLFNVLKGDMSFIGPRPERKFFIDQIMEKDPRYEYLFQIRPGVTSYSTLYNGYTDTIEKMVRRLQYDLYYLRHRSWAFDMRILFMTFMNIVFGKKF